MDADQLDLKITGHVVTPGRVLEDGWIGLGYSVRRAPNDMARRPKQVK